MILVEVDSVSFTLTCPGWAPPPHMPGGFRCKPMSGPAGDLPKNKIRFIHSFSDSLIYYYSPNIQGAATMCQPSAVDAKMKAATSLLCGRRVERNKGERVTLKRSQVLWGGRGLEVHQAADARRSFESSPAGGHDLQQLEISAQRSITKVFRKLKERR